MTIKKDLKVSAENFLIEKNLLKKYEEFAQGKNTRKFSMKFFVKNFYFEEYELWRMEKQKKRNELYSNPEKFLKKRINITKEFEQKLKARPSFSEYLIARNLEKDFKIWQSEVVQKNIMKGIERLDIIASNTFDEDILEVIQHKKTNLLRTLRRMEKDLNALFSLKN